MDAPTRNNLGHAFECGFRLDELLIKPVTGEVAGPGSAEKLDPKVMGVLLLLAQRHGQVVSREDLHEQLWPNAVVTDDALTRCIHELRRQLSRAGGDERYRGMIETLPKRGYRLNSTVTAQEPEVALAVPAPSPSPSPSRRLWLVAGAGAIVLGLVLFAVLRRDEPAAPPVAGVNSIAILPFVDMSEAQDQEFFGDGIAEEILNRLTRSGGLRVISRTSSFAFRGRPTDIREIAETLGVDHVLEGSVRRSGARVRITAQLIAASDNSHVWSETYDRDVGELLAVQDEIAEAVASALRVTLAAGSSGTGLPVKPEAYEIFLQGRFFYNRRAPGDIELAVKYYQDALQIDPEFAAGWAALAGAYNLLRARDRKSPEHWLQLQGEAARAAVELAPGLAVGHARLGQYYDSIADRQNGDTHFETAMALDADDALVMGFAGDRALRRGDLEEVVGIWRRLVERNPLSPTDRGNLAYFLDAAGHLDEAASEYRRTLELNPGAIWGNRFALARVLVRQKRFDSAIAEIMQLPPGEPRDSGMALLHDVPDYEAEADAALQRLAALPIDLENIRLAELYVSRGMNEEAFASLQATFDGLAQSADSAYWARAQARELQKDMVQSWYLQPLHRDPRWAALVDESVWR